MKDNEQAEVVNGEIHHSDTTEEKMSLSDRFGLALSFYPINQDDYFAIVDMLFNGIEVGDIKEFHVLADSFARERGSRSGRIAQQFFNSW
jgi:predicted AAA+ superfamily ATPase